MEVGGFGKDVWVLLALELDNPSLAKLCETNLTVNKNVCGNDFFWYNKILKEFPQSYYDEYKIKDERYGVRTTFKQKYMALERGKDLYEEAKKMKPVKLVGFKKPYFVNPKYIEFFKVADFGDVRIPGKERKEEMISIKSAIMPLLEARMLNPSLMVKLLKEYSDKNNLTYRENGKQWVRTDSLIEKYFGDIFNNIEEKGGDRNKIGAATMNHLVLSLKEEYVPLPEKDYIDFNLIYLLMHLLK